MKFIQRLIAKRRLARIQLQQDELNRFADWMTDNDERDYMQYYHQRSLELDEQR